MLIREPRLIPMDGPAAAPLGDVRIASIRTNGELLQEIGDLTPRAGEPVLEAAGMIALPGFVQVHLHY